MQLTSQHLSHNLFAMTNYQRLPERIKRLPKGLSFTQAARRLRTPYANTLRILHRVKYPAVDGRTHSQDFRRILDPAKVDWRKSKLAIARELGISRQRVHKVWQGLSASTRRRQFLNGKRINTKNTK